VLTAYTAPLQVPTSLTGNLVISRAKSTFLYLAIFSDLLSGHSPNLKNEEGNIKIHPDDILLIIKY